MINFEELDDAGLCLQGVIRVDELNHQTATALSDVGYEVDQYRSLILLAQAGTTLWDRHVRARLGDPDPFENTSLDLVASWFETHHRECSWTLVYPGQASIPLVKLAEAVGWGSPSPLGLTINSQYGLWTAHRIVVLTDLDLETSRDIERLETAPSAVQRHPCDTCADNACVSACPVEAVSIGQAYDVEKCARHRVSKDTDCALQCLARNACPVGTHHRYGAEQMAHHYGAGLRSIEEWLKPGST